MTTRSRRKIQPTTSTAAFLSQNLEFDVGGNIKFPICIRVLARADKTRETKRDPGLRWRKELFVFPPKYAKVTLTSELLSDSQMLFHQERAKKCQSSGEDCS